MKIPIQWCMAALLALPMLGLAQQPANTLNAITDGAAVGDGVADDTAAINAVISTANAQGKDVYFPAGTYWVTGQISMKNGVSLFGDQNGISLLKASSLKVIGEPDNNGSTVANLAVEDLFFLNLSLNLNGNQKDNITVRQCAFATTIGLGADGFQTVVLSRGANCVVEDCLFFCAEADWDDNGIKGIQNFSNTDMVIRRNIFGLDLGNLTWLDTEWKGYANWMNPEARLLQFKAEEGLPNRMGAMKGAMRLNECRRTLVIDNIFNMDPVACGVEQHAGNMDVDHIIYATQAEDVEIIANWFRGHPNSPAGGLKHRDTAGPGVIAANYFVDTPLLLYSYASDLTHGLDNQLVYRNHFEILTDEATFGRNGISYYMSDTLAGVNNKIASNTFECADGYSSISLHNGDPSEWKVYDSNRYISGAPIEVEGNNAPYSTLSGAPSASETSPYDGYVVPDLDIPEYGEEPAVPPSPGSAQFEVLEDTYVKQADPTGNFGTASTLNVRKEGTSEINAFLKFMVSGITNGIVSAKVRLYSLHDHTVGIWRVNDVAWSETSMTWDGRPTMDETISTAAALTEQWVELDVSSVVTGNGTYAFGLKTTSANYRNFSSREGAGIPTLLLTFAEGNNDLDGDLIPNGWEEEYFGGATNAMATADADGDGFDNLAEFIAGTNPTNAGSFFAASSTNLSSGFVVEWSAVSNREYGVWHSVSLTNAFTNLASGILFPQNSYTDTLHAIEAGGFYEVDVKLLP